MKGSNEATKREVFGEGGEGVDVFREAFAAVTVFPVGAGNLGVHVVDVAGKEDAGVDGLVVATVAAAVVGDGVEIGDLEGAEDVVGVFGDLGLEGGHAAEPLADENLAEQIDLTGEDHGLGLEILDIGALREEFRHEVDLVPRFPGESLGGTRQDGRADEDRHIGKVLDELGHQGEILRTVILGRHMEGNKDDVRRRQVVVHPLRRVADQHLHVGIVLLQPHLEGTADVAASDNTNVDHMRTFPLKTAYSLPCFAEVTQVRATYRKF